MIFTATDVVAPAGVSGYVTGGGACEASSGIFLMIL